ncbi:hypothetical protein AMECASPLE_037561 [Ameca splendens]|uniref:BESS domain-containing protein n=1 Tax=Ameca splendens TaxID=208324 RepID=A0ABV1A3B8_9TELE
MATADRLQPHFTPPPKKIEGKPACRQLPLSGIHKYSCDFISQKIPIFSEDVCRKKWKGLRDMYLKERRKELEKRRSGAAAGAAKKWRFSAVLPFLDPFVAPRPTTSNMGQVEEMAEDLPAPSPEEDTSETEDTNGDDTEERSIPSEAPAASSVSDSAPSSSAAAQPPVGRRRRRVRPLEEPSEVERELLEALQNRPTSPPPPWVYSSMEHFFLGLAPSLERLPLDKQELIKLKLMQMIFEHSTVLLNLDHVDPE